MIEKHSPFPPPKLPEDIQAWSREMRSNMTDAEKLLWQLLRNRRLAGNKFRRQYPIERYILDFYCVEHKLAIELDGGQHALSAQYDEHRGAYLTTKGIRIVRFWNNQVLTKTINVLEIIYSQLTPPIPPLKWKASSLASGRGLR
jgi:very-short-patch-repair endonuclease